MKSTNVIRGVRPVTEAVSAGKEIEKVMIRRGLTGEGVRGLIRMLSERKIPYQLVPSEKLNRISRGNHQGIIGFVSNIEYASLDHIITSAFQAGKDPIVIVLDRISDVRNFGAIARTAEGLGIDALVIPSKGNAMINDDAMKASAGALNHIAVCREAGLQPAIRYLKECGLQVIACSEKAGLSVYSQEIRGPVAMLFGSEEDGISPPLLKMADMHIHIPMKGKIASFNISVSVAIIAAEIIRRRNS
jgi:23S rRNA (guanosine2251-2'-O)-methyltransferase